MEVNPAPVAERMRQRTSNPYHAGRILPGAQVVMSQDIEHRRLGHTLDLDQRSGNALVVPRQSRVRAAERREIAAVESHDLDVEAVNEHGDTPARVGVPDSDVVKPPPATKSVIRPALSTRSKHSLLSPTLTKNDGEGAAFSGPRSKPLPVSCAPMPRCGRSSLLTVHASDRAGAGVAWGC